MIKEKNIKVYEEESRRFSCRWTKIPQQVSPSMLDITGRDWCFSVYNCNGLDLRKKKSAALCHIKQSEFQGNICLLKMNCFGFVIYTTASSCP